LTIGGSTGGILLSNNSSTISLGGGNGHIRQTTNNQIQFGLVGGDRAYWASGCFIKYDFDSGYSWTTNSVVSGTIWGFTSSTAHQVTQKSGTNAQTFRVSGTWTSTSSYELINIKGKASANFEFGPENGSAGGTLRGLTIGGYSAGTTTIAPWLTFTNAGAATFSNNLTLPSLVLSGAISAAAWTTNGIGIAHTNRTITDTTSTGTVAAAYTNVLGVNTIAASAATTYTTYGTLYLGNPTAGTNVTIANAISLITAGAVKVGAYTLPATDGTSSQVLQTNGSGSETWQTVSGGGGITTAQARMAAILYGGGR
jgi:hypothetical protein